jgi:hypothetical protein
MAAAREYRTGLFGGFKRRRNVRFAGHFIFFVLSYCSPLRGWGSRLAELHRRRSSTGTDTHRRTACIMAWPINVEFPTPAGAVPDSPRDGPCRAVSGSPGPAVTARYSG